MPVHKIALEVRQAEMRNRLPRLPLTAAERATRVRPLRVHQEERRIARLLLAEPSSKVDQMLEMAAVIPRLHYSEDVFGSLLQSSLGGKSFGLAGEPIPAEPDFVEEPVKPFPAKQYHQAGHLRQRAFMVGVHD